MSSNCKNILFRVDSSSTIGTGHIMRDLVLAKQYKDSNIIFATQNLNGNINHKILESNFKVKLLKSNDINELNCLIKKLKIDMIVIDHYEIDHLKEKEIKKSNPKVKILSFDDTYEKHYCDILLNHNISADLKKYKGLVPKNCKLKCGSKYTLLREEFLKEKKKSNKKKSLSTNNYSLTTIYIAMGGADHLNLNIKILKVIKSFYNKKRVKVNVVTTSANKNLEKLKKYCKTKKWINLNINSNKVANLMAQSDFAIVTPSVTVNEVYFMKLPFITIKTAQNQEEIYRYLKKKKYKTMKKFEKKKLFNLITKQENENR